MHRNKQKLTVSEVFQQKCSPIDAELKSQNVPRFYAPTSLQVLWFANQKSRISGTVIEPRFSNSAIAGLW